VGQFKLIQHTVDRLEVQVVPDTRWNDAARLAVIQGLQARMGAGLVVELKLQDVIAPEASGKHRYVVSHVTLQAGLAQATVG
jgi:phenylacetate-CoA ligase